MASIRRWSRLVGAAVNCALLSGCPAQTGPAKREPSPVQETKRTAAPPDARAQKTQHDPPGTRRVGWGAGEQLTFTVRLFGIDGGRGAISVGEPSWHGARQSLKIRGLSETVPFVSAIQRLREEVVTRVDLHTLTPAHTVTERLRGERRRRIESDFEEPPLVVQYITQDQKTVRHNRRVPPPVFDLLTALYWLRTTELIPGRKLDARVLTGLTLYRVEVVPHPGERMMALGSARETQRLDGTAQEIQDSGLPRPTAPLKFSLWLSADATRIPLRAEGNTKLGPMRAVISSYGPASVPLVIGPPLIQKRWVQHGASTGRRAPLVNPVQK